MKTKFLIYGLLSALLLVIDWQMFMVPVETNVTEDVITASTKQKNESFSSALSNENAGFAKALNLREFSFPSDHGPHNDFRSEWWYFTGNLTDRQGRQFGYELTFFRFATKAGAPESKSVWRSNQTYMAHLTLTDVQGNRFYTDERFSRAGNDLAGAANKKYHVWLYDWSAKTQGETDFPLRLQAKSHDFAIDLLLTSPKSYVLQGDRGLSQKSREPGNASYYYSYPRLSTEGTVSVADKQFSVTGTSWMDREWSASALSSEQSGWDWFALQLSDNTELMFYRLRRKDGQADSNSAGSLVLADNAKVALKDNDVTIKILDSWTSPHSKITYPSRWRLAVPSQGLEVEVDPLLGDQELKCQLPLLGRSGQC
ncbi:MAG: lipocalin-like domain-containing protein [Methylococcaceae bacterium]|nr:lipocalin-like domain-containing protein [Methylococcaceae bacterium]